MAEIMEEDKVTIKEEISTVEDTCTVYVAEDVKEENTEKTENQGMGKHFLHIFIGWSIFDSFIPWLTAFLEIIKNLRYLRLI